MSRVISCAAIVTASLFVWAAETPVAAPKPVSQRRLLHPANPDDLHPAIRKHVERLLAADQLQADPDGAKFKGVFLRVISRRFAVDGDGKVNAEGRLGGKPFVYLTVPEAAYGRTLLRTFSAIGYHPEEALDAEGGVEKVALVFAYPDTTPACDVRDGRLPEAWDHQVYPATWGNLLALTERLAADPDRVAIRPDGGFTPTQLQLRSDRERLLLLGFPDAGKRRVAAAPYDELRDVGGADWEYRQILERAMGASEHFRGDGRTKLTLTGGRRTRAGFPEFLGPNFELAPLAEAKALAVVALGALRIPEE